MYLFYVMGALCMTASLDYLKYFESNSILTNRTKHHHCVEKRRNLLQDAENQTATVIVIHLVFLHCCLFWIFFLLFGIKLLTFVILLFLRLFSFLIRHAIIYFTSSMSTINKIKLPHVMDPHVSVIKIIPHRINQKQTVVVLSQDLFLSTLFQDYSENVCTHRLWSVRGLLYIGNSKYFLPSSSEQLTTRQHLVPYLQCLKFPSSQ